MSVSYQLIEILANGKFHSGESLGRRLGVSRAAIWKQVQQVRNLGLAVHAIPGKGYRLSNALELLEEEKIRAALGAEASQLVRLDLFHEVDSTNDYLRGLPERVAGSVCLAEQQSRGRGRRGRSWVSPYGVNLYLSLGWLFSRPASALSGLSLVMGLSLLQALASLGLVGAGVKWPNDVYFEGKKLAGILVEISGEVSGPCHAIIGVGVNVAMPQVHGDTIDQRWSDVCQMSDMPVSRNKLAGKILQQMLRLLPQFEERGLAPFYDAWIQHDIARGQRVEIVQGDKTIVGIARGIDQDGAFLLETPDGLRSFTSGEVSLRVGS